MNHQFIWTPLVPIEKKGAFKRKLSLVCGLGKNTLVRPIFLKTPSSNLGDYLNLKNVFHDFLNVFRTLEHAKPDAVLVSYALNGFPIAILKPLLGSRLFTIATGGDVNLHRHFLHRIIRRAVFDRSNAVFAVSSELQSKIYSESGHRVNLLPTGVDPSFFRRLDAKSELRKKWHFNPEDNIALTVSNLETHKGVDVAIKAINIIRKDGRGNLKLVVVGEGTQESVLRSLIIESNLEKAVFLLGEKSRLDLLELYNIADLFLLTSYTEGLPFSMLEAMACEKLCIASPVGDIPKVVRTGYNGILADSVSPQSFATDIETALTMGMKELASMKRNARKTVLENYDLRAISQDLLASISSSAET